MAHPSMQKREKERNRQAKQGEKLARRQERKESGGPREWINGVDPDLAGIVAGPQPIPDED